MEPSKSDLLQGTLDMLILKVVAGEPAHGYSIAQQIRKLSREALQIQQGSLYPALHRLEKKKWLNAEWRESESGRKAKYYSLTVAGRKQLAVEEDGWERLIEAIGLVMRSQTR